MINKKFGIGMIGCGLIGTFRAESIGSSGKLIAVTDHDISRAQKLSIKMGARVYKDWLEIIKLSATIPAMPPMTRPPRQVAGNISTCRRLLTIIKKVTNEATTSKATTLPTQRPSSNPSANIKPMPIKDINIATMPNFGVLSFRIIQPTKAVASGADPIIKTAFATVVSKIA